MRVRHLATLIGLTLTFTAIPIARDAFAWNSLNQRNYLGNFGDAFWNYDYTGYGGNREGNVDWAVQFMFKNKAEIDKVKQNLNRSYFTSAGGLKMAEMDEGIGWFEDEDRGRKRNPGCPGYNIHYRVYAEPGYDQSNPNVDTMYNPYWGFWIMATTHYDENDGCSGYTKLFGTSEQAEDYITSWARSSITAGRYWTVWADAWSFYNCASPSFPDCGRATGPYYWRTEWNGSEYHRWEGNGLATIVDVY